MGHRRGFPARESLLTDNLVNFITWVKMYVPGDLTVYNKLVVTALRLKSDGTQSPRLNRELRALARNFKIGNARFDVCWSTRLNILREKTMKAVLTTYDTTNVELRKIWKATASNRKSKDEIRVVECFGGARLRFSRN